MSVVQEFKNPMNPRETVLMAHGIIKRVSIKPIKGADPETGIKTTVWQGKKIESSHTISLLIAEVDENDKLLQGGEEMWVSMGDKLLKPGHQDSVSIKIDDKWETVVPGWIVNIPLKSNEYNGKTYYKGSLAKIVVLGAGEVPASAPKAQQKGQQQPKQGQGKQPQGNQQKPAQKGANDVLRIYGTITAIDGKSVTVDDQKIGVGVMVVNNPNQLKELVVGGRVAAVCDTAGNVLSGFKAYPPLENKTPRKSTYDVVDIETGHCINAMQILLDKGLDLKNLGLEEIDIAKKLHTLTVALKAEYAKSSGTTEEAVAQSVGNSILNACRRVNISNTQHLFENIEAEAKNVLINFSEKIYAWIKDGGDVKTDANPTQEEHPKDDEPDPGTLENPQNGGEEEGGHDGWDWDESIPF